MNRIKKKIKFLIHPILFGLYPLIYLYSANIYDISIAKLINPMLLLMGISIGLLAIIYLIIRKLVTASLLASFILYVIFSFDDLYNLFLQNVWSIGRAEFILIPASCFILYAFWILRNNKYLSGLNLLFNVFIISLCAAAILNIIRIAYLNLYPEKSDSLKQVHELTNTGLKGNQNSRDIYYLIFDQYSRGDILRDNFSYDNTKFTKALEKRGFYVADKSYSNYPHTLHSLASSLNMKYINYLTEQQRGKGNWPRALQLLIYSNKVCKDLVSIGYQCIDLAHFDINGGSISKSINKEISDKVDTIFADQATIIQILYRKSIFPVIFSDFMEKQVTRRAIVNKSRAAKREDILLRFQKLTEIPDVQEPTLTILHLLIPYHSPFVFDRHGNYVTLEEEKSKTKKDNYLEQIRFLNSKILETVDILIKKSDPKPVIIIQSDEGSYPDGYNYIEPVLTKYSADILRYKFAIFNAYYLPDVDNTYLYPSITPVNTFRLIFKLYFNQKYELLQDRHYNTNYANYYRYLDVSDKLKKK